MCKRVQLERWEAAASVVLLLLACSRLAVVSWHWLRAGNDPKFVTGFEWIVSPILTASVCAFGLGFVLNRGAGRRFIAAAGMAVVLVVLEFFIM